MAGRGSWDSWPPAHVKVLAHVLGGQPARCWALSAMGLVDRHGVPTKQHTFFPGPQTPCSQREPKDRSMANPLGSFSAGVCDRAPDFLSPSGNQVLGPALGSVVTLNCTAQVVSGPHCPLPSVQWLKDGLPLGNGSHYDIREDTW